MKTTRLGVLSFLVAILAAFHPSQGISQSHVIDVFVVLDDEGCAKYAPLVTPSERVPVFHDGSGNYLPASIEWKMTNLDLKLNPTATSRKQKVQVAYDNKPTGLCVGKSHTHMKSSYDLGTGSGIGPVKEKTPQPKDYWTNQTFSCWYYSIEAASLPGVCDGKKRDPRIMFEDGGGQLTPVAVLHAPGHPIVGGRDRSWQVVALLLVGIGAAFLSLGVARKYSK